MLPRREITLEHELCLSEVTAMVVAVQQPSAERTAIFTVCVLSITAHLPEQWQYTKPAQLNGVTDSKTVPASKIKGQCTGNTTNTLIVANRLRTDTKTASTSKVQQYEYCICRARYRYLAYLNTSLLFFTFLCKSGQFCVPGCIDRLLSCGVTSAGLTSG